MALSADLGFRSVRDARSRRSFARPSARKSHGLDGRRMRVAIVASNYTSYIPQELSRIASVVEAYVPEHLRQKAATLLQQSHSELLAPIEDTIHGVRNYFPNCTLVLEPDRPDLGRLALYVHCDLAVDELLDREQRFLEEWWLPTYGDKAERFSVFARRRSRRA